MVRLHLRRQLLELFSKSRDRRIVLPSRVGHPLLQGLGGGVLLLDGALQRHRRLALRLHLLLAGRLKRRQRLLLLLRRTLLVARQLLLRLAQRALERRLLVLQIANCRGEVSDRDIIPMWC